MKSRFSWVLVGFVGLSVLGAAGLSTGCSSAGATDSGGAVSETAAAVVTTEGGAFSIAVHSGPDASPSRGVNTLRLVVTRVSDGTPVSGLTLDVVPWMPAMGHGASVKPTVEPGPEPGSYDVTNVALVMPGLWEIRTTISGSTSDHVAPQFEIH
jgi:hypothetical protein